MKHVLLDHCLPHPIRNMLRGCTAVTTRYMGWDELQNGSLLSAAERAGFDVLITSDKNLRYQQNLTGRRIAIIELPTNRLPALLKIILAINATTASIQPGAYEVIT